MQESLLEVRDLVTAFDTDAGQVTAVDGVSFTVEKGKTLGLVGESGCGKSVTALSIIRLLPQPMGKILGGRILFGDSDLTQVSEEEMHKVRGGRIGMIFQDPRQGGNSLARSTGGGVSPPALRRHAAARGDCHGACLQAQPGHCR